MILEMYKVYAEFESVETAEHAAGQLRDRIKDIGRVVTRKMNWAHDPEELSADIPASAGWLFTPNEYYQGGTFLTAAASVSEPDEGEKERHYEPSARHEYTLCAEGSREDVEQAAHLLRSLGGTRIGIMDAPGEFFDETRRR